MSAVETLVWNGLGLSLPFFIEFEELFVKYSRKHNLEDERFGRRVIFAICEGQGFVCMKLLKRLLSLKIPFDRTSAVDICKEKGVWDAYEMLIMSTMGKSLKNTVLRERNRIEALLAFSSSFFAENKLCFEKGSKDYAMMEQLTVSLVNAFENRRPISEDLLFLSWKWNNQISDGLPLESILGKSLCKTLEGILVTPVNAFDWIWFKANLLNSAVSYSPFSPSVLLTL